MNRTKVIAALVVTLISPAAISAPALAGDNKVYSGSECKPIEGSLPSDLFYGNGATNLGNVNVNVVCPVVRDDTSGPVGSGPNAFIDVSLDTVSCSLNTTNLYGLGTYATGTAVPFSVVPGVYRFDIRAVPQVSQGAYNITCTLPPSTAVLRYSVSE